VLSDKGPTRREAGCKAQGSPRDAQHEGHETMSPAPRAQAGSSLVASPPMGVTRRRDRLGPADAAGARPRAHRGDPAQMPKGRPSSAPAAGARPRLHCRLRRIATAKKRQKPPHADDHNTAADDHTPPPTTTHTAAEPPHRRDATTHRRDTTTTPATRTTPRRRPPIPAAHPHTDADDPPPRRRPPHRRRPPPRDAPEPATPTRGLGHQQPPVQQTKSGRLGSQELARSSHGADRAHEQRVGWSSPKPS